MGAQMTKKDFLVKARQKHGTRYSYTESVYINSETPLKIRCRKHGLFNQTPQTHYASQGCPACGRESFAEKTGVGLAGFLRRAGKLHGKTYDYSSVVYRSLKRKVKIICPIHGIFDQSPQTHLEGSGCPNCKGSKTGAALRGTTDKFIAEAKAVHGRLYDYTKSVYVTSGTPITITCRKHGDFTQMPRVHVHQQSGCPKCKSKNYSKVAVRWIEEEAYSRRLKGVRHALAGGEFRLPGTDIRVDGYHHRTRTVFEFHGDAYHGNLRRFSPRSKPNPFSAKTAQRLNAETLARDKKIRALGYNLVVMWESDYRQQK